MRKIYHGCGHYLIIVDSTFDFYSEHVEEWVYEKLWHHPS